MYMKISSDTKTIGFYYSLDKELWQLVRLFRNDYPSFVFCVATFYFLGDGPLNSGESVIVQAALSPSTLNTITLGVAVV